MAFPSRTRSRRGILLAAVAVLAGLALAVTGCIAVSGRQVAPGDPAGSPGAATGSGAADSARSDPATDCVATTLAGLSLAGRVGQLLMVGTPIANPGSLADTIRRYRLGGVFLAGRSSQSAASLRQGIQALQQVAAGATGMRAQVALDQEGGLVQTVKGNDFPVIPSAVQQGRWDQQTLRARTGDWAHRLAEAGVTMDLAPVADTVPAGTASANPPIGALNRQYGSAPDAVARHVATVVEAAQAAGVLTTLKHFPGLGRVLANTDTSAHAVDRTATVTDPYLQPFSAGIRAGTGAVMVSSASYPQLDPDAIAAFSTPIVTGLLRQRLGFSGLVVSDDLGAAAAVGGVPVGDRAVRFVTAGGDLVLTIRPGDAGPMTTALLAAARRSPAFAARVADAAQHVLRAKHRAGLLPCSRTAG